MILEGVPIPVEWYQGPGSEGCQRASFSLWGLSYCKHDRPILLAAIASDTSFSWDLVATYNLGYDNSTRTGENLYKVS